MDKNVTVNKDMSIYRVRETGGLTQFRPFRLSALSNVLRFSSRGSPKQAWTNSMNQEQRQDDRPRVASFLIDDILAPQALPTVTQCTSSQSALQSSSRHLSTEVSDNTLICNQPLNAGCLACYGTVFMVYIPYYYYYVRATINSLPVVIGFRNAQSTLNTLKTILLYSKRLAMILIWLSKSGSFLVMVWFHKNEGYLIKLNRCF